MYKDITECCCASQKPTLQDPVLPYGISVKAYLSPTPADGQAAVEEHEAREAMTETAKVLAREPAYGCARGQLGAKRAQRHGWQGMAGARSFAAPEYGNRVHARGPLIFQDINFIEKDWDGCQSTWLASHIGLTPLALLLS